MKHYAISELARLFGLSRSTLLYYDRIGLLQASNRTASGYRQYTQKDCDRLERICMFRSAGLCLADIRRLLSEAQPSAAVLEKRLEELQRQIRYLRSQQHMIIAMLKRISGKTHTPVVDKTMWVRMLAAAGMDEAAMAAWHAQFEQCAPCAHHDFLLSLGIPEQEALKIRQWSRSFETDP